jgi:hypothetical protein
MTIRRVATGNPLIFILALTSLCSGAQAQPTISTPAAPSATLQSVCPDRDLFPNPSSPGLRNSYAVPFEQDYPGIVYDAGTGLSYWLDYRDAPKRPLVPINSYFTPITYTTEKLFVMICGLHFDATPSVTPTTITVADGGPQIDDGTVIASPAAPSTPAVATKPAAATESAAYAHAIKPRKPRLPPVPKPPVCDPDAVKQLVDQANAAAKAATDAITHFNASLNEIRRQLNQAGLPFNSAGQPDYPPFWSPDTSMAISYLPTYVDDGVSLTDLDLHNPHHFTSTRTVVRDAGQQLASAVSNWNTLLQSPDFLAAWKEFQKSSLQFQAATKQIADWNNKYTALDASSKACVDQQHIDAPPDMAPSEASYATETQMFNNRSQFLSDARAALVRAQLAMNRWYSRSSVSFIQMLPSVSGNSITQIAVQVTNPSVPFSPAGMSIARVKLPSLPAPGPKPTVITVDRSIPRQTKISVGDGTASGTSVNTVVTDLPSAAGATGDPVTIHLNPQPPAAAAAPAAAPASASAPASAPAASASPAPPKDPSAPIVVSPSTLPAASYLVARHRFVNFVPSGGLLVSRFNGISFNAETLNLTTVTTTTTYTVPIPVSGITPPCPPPMTGAPQCSGPTTTITSAASTTNFAYSSPGGSFQETAIAGITWFPFAARDTFSVTHIGKSMRPSIHTYSHYDSLSKLGFFVGTNVAGLGPFVVAPTYEVKPGIQLFAGLSLNTKTTLTSGVVPCTSPGSSTINEAPQTTTSSANGLSTTTTVNVQLTSGCSNASATMLGGTVVPTQTSLVPAFSFGFLLNTNLFKYLSFGQ